MDENNHEGGDSSKENKLKTISYEIKQSWQRDCDRTEYINQLINMLKEMLTHDSLEEYFSNDEKLLSYFMGDFLNDVISYILIQPKVFGDNGDDIALDLLLHIYKLFLKFHKNNKYSLLFEKIRKIFNLEQGSMSFFTSHKYEDDEKNYDYLNFNSKFCSEFKKNIEIKKFNVGDEIDFLFDNKYGKFEIEKKTWIRGKIKDIRNEEYVIDYFDRDDEKIIPLNDYKVFEKNTKTKDWDWRTNLKKYDVIDCYDRYKWYPATITEVKEEEEVNGYKNIKYNVGFRLYPDHFKNPDNENDTYDKHIDIWKINNSEIDLKPDRDNQQFVGDKENYDEEILFCSKRIQKFNTFSACQQKNLNYSYQNNYHSNNNDDKNPMKLMNDKLVNEEDISIDEYFNYELEGNKNIILGNSKNFYYFYALLLKLIEKENGFVQFIEILKDKPNTDEIYNIFFILSCCFPYIHRNYFIENSNIIKSSLIDYINNLTEKEMRNLPKDLIDIITNLLYKINEYNIDSKDNNDEKDSINLYDEITITLSLKSIKTSIFDRRLQGIKALNEFIEKNQNNKEVLKRIIVLIKQNKIISEIFGANYHSQIIRRSTEIVKLLLVENELENDDIKLIWSCTKRGDLEAKLTILKLLSELAPNLKEDYIEMLLTNIISNVDKKINQEEIDLVYKLSIQDKVNDKNILLCCDYFGQSLLVSNETNLKDNAIMEKLLLIIEKKDEYLKKLLDICENCIKNNDKTIMSYSILSEIINKYSNESNETINEFTKDKHLLKLFEDNFNLYIKQSKELLSKNNISSSDGDIIDKYIIDGFTHLENIHKRMEVYLFLINQFYTDYDFIPFLKKSLINNSVSPNDQLIFYDFVQKYISNNENKNDEAIKRKEKIRQELFELLSENKQSEIKVEQLKLFIALFFDINKEKITLKENDKYEANNKDIEYEIIKVENIEELKGLDKLWNIIFQIKKEEVLSVAINIIFQIYKNKNIEKLLEKCTNLMKEEDATSEIIGKCIILLKLIIIESEKNILFKTKPHLSLIKNCLINLPLEITGRQNRNNDDPEKYLLTGNTNINDLKILLSKMYNIIPKGISFTFSDKYLKFLKKNKLIEKEEIDESNNNTSLFELIIKNNNILSELKPKEKIIFNTKKIEKEKLMINGEMNPKLKNIFKEWFRIFTEGKDKMDKASIAKFVSGVTRTSSNVSEEDIRVKNFLKANGEKSEDNEEDGENDYVSEEGFINFYNKALYEKKKEKIVWENLKEMGIGEDLRKKDESFEIEYIDNEKLPRYKLGNDLPFIENLIKKYYKEPNSNFLLIDFLFNLTTNESIYNEILEKLFNNEEKENKESFVNKVFQDNNNTNYIEQNYIFIIIESILEDLEIYLYNKYIDSNDYILFGKNQYKIISEKYEPFDNEDKIKIKLEFVKHLMKTENLQKIINQVNDIFEKLLKIKNDKENNNINIISKVYDCCLRGLKIINILNNFCSNNIKKNENCLKELKENGIYNLGYYNLSLLFPELDFKNELDNISYSKLSNNLINYLNDSQKKENEDENNNYLQKECLDLLINLLSSKKQLLEEYTTRDENKKLLMVNLFKNYFSGEESPNKTYFIKNITQSINKAKNNQNNDYIKFLFHLVNSLLDNLINSQIKSDENIKKENNREFTPDNTFFELYNNLYKIMSENKDNNADSKEENSLILKIYELLMKSLNNMEQDEICDNKIFISLLKLLEISIKEDEKLKKEILFKEANGITLFNFLLNKCISYLNSIYKKEESLIDTDNNENNEDNENDKFICLDNIKDEEKKEDKSQDELIEISNSFILSCFQGTKDPKLISELLKIISLIKKLKKKNGNENDDEDEDKNDESPTYNQNFMTKNCGHVGLKNLGCTCYMNSIMQQMYMVPTFRYAIMSADDNEPEKPFSTNRASVDDDNLLHQLQIMYTYLTYSDRMDYNPRDFCFSYKDFDGNPMNLGAQQDSQEFYNNFCDKIENSLKKTKFKYIISDVFCGTTCNLVVCQNCQHTSNRFEDFYNLTLEVKNISNLNDSLQKLSVPEIIDDFKCSNCNQKVTINKVTALNKLPNVLVVHLKRFYLNYETCQTQKINSKFEFPKTLNLKAFCSEEITKKETEDIYNKVDDYYEYELKGINVHTGSADGGHYFSFIDVNRDGKNNILNDYPNEKWLQFNDSHVSVFDTETIPNECYGGSPKGYSYENIQNGYLLLYERKKKTPIKILLEEKDIDKDKDNIIRINKENKSQIYKEYDLSRIKPDIKEEDLYNKIFFEEEKNEYFKYIPYYNIPKYAPRKVYNKIMKENNKTPSTKSNNNKAKIKYQDYLGILFSILREKDFDIDNENYDDNSKEIVLSIALNNFIKTVNSNESFNDEQKIEINSVFSFIINKLIKPVIKKDTNINILKTINNLLVKEESAKKIFSCNAYHNSSDEIIINEENTKDISDILFDLVKIFFDKKIDMDYNNELKKIYNCLLILIEYSNRAITIDYSNNDENYYPMIYVYKLLYKLLTFNEEILKKFLKKEIISNLLGKLENENKNIREIIYESVIYIIKHIKDYNRELFDLEEYEKEGKYEFEEKQNLNQVSENIIKILFSEKRELLNMLLVILANDDIQFSKLINYKIIYNLYKFCSENNRMNDLIEVVLSLVKINDKYTFERLYNIMGYPNLIIKQIPRKKRKNDRYNYYGRSDSDSDDDREQENDDEPSISNQKWPLFGEKLINGDINRQIYEYVCINHRNNGFCLLGILFPNENNNEEKKDINNDSDDENDREKKKEYLSNEDKKDIILEIINNCLGDKNNYSLFKYIYLTPAPSIKYRNLYEKMKEFAQEEDKAVTFENYKEKEEKFIKNIEEEIDKFIKKIKNNDIDNNDNYYNYDNDEENAIIPGKEEFKCIDKNLINFIGFNSNIIPGEIVKEEIIQIAQSGKLAMYRIEYYTKYFNTEELRDTLMRKTKNKENSDEEEKDDLNKERGEEGENKEKDGDLKKSNEEDNNDKNEEKNYDEDNEERTKNVQKFDISEVNENKFIYSLCKKNKPTIILEDKSIKDRNKVIKTLFRFIFTNKDSNRKPLRASIKKSSQMKDLLKSIYFFPSYIYDQIESNNMVNFYNIIRTRGDLPFIQREDIIISIDLNEKIIIT